MQAKFGDYDTNKYATGTFVNEKFLPQSVIEQYRLSESEWEKRITDWWKEHTGLLRYINLRICFLCF